MLTSHLEKIWESATEEARLQASTEARIIIENLIHYNKKNGRYYQDDVQRLAAEILRLQKPEPQQGAVI